MGIESRIEGNDRLSAAETLHRLVRGEAVTGFDRLTNEQIKAIDENILKAPGGKQSGSLAGGDIPNSLNLDTVMYMYEWLTTGDEELAITIRQDFLDGREKDLHKGIIEYKKAA